MSVWLKSTVPPANVVADLFDDDDDAASQLDGVEELWTTAEFLSGPGERVDNRFDFVGIEQVGAVVVVTVASNVDLDTSDDVLELLFRSELQFFHT